MEKIFLSAQERFFSREFPKKRLTEPGRPTIPLSRDAAVAQLDRATGYEPVGREFESLQAHHIFQGLWHICHIPFFVWLCLKFLADTAIGGRSPAPVSAAAFAAAGESPPGQRLATLRLARLCRSRCPYASLCPATGMGHGPAGPPFGRHQSPLMPAPPEVRGNLGSPLQRSI